ncbi:MAG: glycine cleavage system protein GcvH [Planctomycetia bacterium]|nr:glycine cleavage system protein GcvH [Planctomycetia bacterium]OQZ05879.1 MAG: glycine cleavage system protein H [Planctomycetes bacterium UTPLA1]
MGVPTDRRYLKSHEWHKLDGDICTIGITRFAADELTDITYVSLPKVGKELTAGKPLGEIESVKATSDLYTGVSGVVTEVNGKLGDAPELVNNDSFGDGWLVKVKLSDPSQVEKLMTAQQYDAQIAG